MGLLNGGLAMATGAGWGLGREHAAALAVEVLGAGVEPLNSFTDESEKPQWTLP